MWFSKEEKCDPLGPKLQEFMPQKDENEKRLSAMDRI